MADEVVGIKIKVDGSEAVESTKSLRAQLKEAIADVASLSDKFGISSKETIEAAKRAAELKDRIGDAKSMVDAFNPDAKFKAFSASLSGVAGGFAALQGAMALFGAESEDVQKMLLKVQSAMAISQGLQAVGESIDSFKQLGTVIQSTTVFQRANEIANKAAAASLRVLGISAETTSTAFKVMKGAIISTGIGVLVIALGEAIAAFQNFQSAAEKAAKAQDDLNRSMKRYADAGLKGEQDFINNQEKIEVAKAKATGKSEKEIFQLEQGFRGQRIKSLQRHWKEVGDGNSEARMKDKEEIDKINAEGLAAQYEFQEKQKRRAQENAKQGADRSRAEREKQKALQKERDAAELDAVKRLADLKNETILLGIKDEFESRRIAIGQQLFKESADITKNEKLKEETKKALIIALRKKAEADIAKLEREIKDEKDKKDQEDLKKKLSEERQIRELDIQAKIELLDKENAAFDGDYEQDIARLETKDRLLNKQMEIELENTELTEFQKTEIRKKYADARSKVADQEVAVEKAAQQAKVDLNNKYLDLYAQFGGFLQQIAGKNKALAIAGLVIDKGASIAKIITQMNTVPAILPPGIPNPAYIPARIGGALSIASVIAASVQGIQSINSAGIPGGSSGGSGGGGGSVGATAAAPIAPPAPIQNTVTQLSPNSINQLGSATNRAYIVESDVTNSQDRIKRINRAARLT